MKFKMNITNYEDFEQAIAECKDPVYTLNERGDKRRITQIVLTDLKQQYICCKKNITIWCLCSSNSDYFKLLKGTVWQC